MKKIILALAVVAVLFSSAAFAGAQDSGGPKGTDSTDGGKSIGDLSGLFTSLGDGMPNKGGADDIGPREQV